MLRNRLKKERKLHLNSMPTLLNSKERLENTMMNTILVLQSPKLKGQLLPIAEIANKLPKDSGRSLKLNWLSSRNPTMKTIRRYSIFPG